MLTCILSDQTQTASAGVSFGFANFAAAAYLRAMPNKQIELPPQAPWPSVRIGGVFQGKGPAQAR